MGVDSLAIDAPYGRQPETLAAALRYLERSGNADVAEALGLVDPELPARRPCPDCGHPLPDPVTNGGHKPCQRRACKAARVEEGAR